jgi:electron transport complex protein RnfD
MTKKGAVIFGLGCGVVTSLIRLWGSYPEGVSFAILFMNALTPLIDRVTIRKPFGYVAPVKAEVK